jgi:hypothetical protein
MTSFAYTRFGVIAAWTAMLTGTARFACGRDTERV